MFQQIIIRSLVIGSALVSLAACGNKGGFDLGGLNADGNLSFSIPPGASDPGVDPNDPNAYEKMQYKGYVSGGSDDGTLVVDLDKAKDALLVILPLQVNPYIKDAQGEIPDLPGLTYMTYKDDKDAAFLAVSVPLRYVRKGASFLSSARLPNGDPLPQIASGELPSVAVAIPGNNNVQFNFYIGVNIVGLYVSSPYDPYYSLQFPVRKGVETIGYFHTVPAKSGFNGGFFLNTQMPDSVAAIIDDHFRF